MCVCMCASWLLQTIHSPTPHSPPRISSFLFGEFSFRCPCCCCCCWCYCRFDSFAAMWHFLDFQTQFHGNCINKIKMRKNKNDFIWLCFCSFHLERSQRKFFLLLHFSVCACKRCFVVASACCCIFHINYTCAVGSVERQVRWLT